MSFNIFTLTERPDPDLFHRRNDANDPRLGERVSTTPAGYETSSCVILGCPQDEGVRRNHGRIGAAEGPASIRRALYRLTTFGIAAETLFDLGDTIIQPTLEETHDLHRMIVESLLSDGKTVIVLGGGNDISYPDVSALSAVFTDPLVFNIDAHFDVRADAVRNSGTPYRQLLDGHIIRPSHFYEMAYQRASNSEVYYEYLQSLGVQMSSLGELQSAGVTATFQRIIEAAAVAPIFWGFDLDAICAADSPGVSAPAAIGLSGADLCALAHLAGRSASTRIIEFSEVNPSLDPDDRTSRLTALAIHHFLAGRNEAQQPGNRIQPT